LNSGRGWFLPLWKRKGVEEIKLCLTLTDNKRLDDYLSQNEETADYLAQERVENAWSPPSQTEKLPEDLERRLREV